jgi:hypothetical protein
MVSVTDTYVVTNDISWAAVPSYICPGSTLNLASYINNYYSGLVTFSGTGVSGTTFTASASGSFVITATATFKNGTTSYTTTIVVGDTPSYTNPTPQTICPNGTAIFSTTASSNIPMSFQWQESTNGGATWANISNGGIYSNATAANLTLTNVTSNNGYQYRVIVQNGCNTLTSAPTTLSLLTNVGIGVQPTPSTTFCEGNAYSISVFGTGTSPTYQWYKNGVAISGATSSNFNIATTTGNDSGTYTANVSGTCGPVVTSSNAVLTVNTNIAITGQPVSPANSCPNPASDVTISGLVVTGTNPIYQWQSSPDNSTWTSLSDGTNFSGSATASLTIKKANITTPGTTYYRVIVSSGATPSACGPSVTSSVVTHTILTNAGIATQPAASTTLCPGANYTVTVVGSGTNPTYQWYKNGTAITGATNSTYTITGVTASDAGTYTVKVTGTCGPVVTSNNAVLNINTNIGIATQPVSSTTLCPGATFGISVIASGTSPTYQWYKNGTAITGATSSAYSIATVSATDAATYTVKVSGACGTAVTSGNSVLTVNTNVGVGTQPTATTSLCPGSTYNLSTVGSGTGPYTYQWYKNGTAISGATLASYSIASVSSADAATYTVKISGTCGSPVTSSNAVLTVYSPPTFTSNLSNTSYCTGSNITLSVSGTTTPGTLNYTWRLSTDAGSTWNTISNIAPYSGATTSALTIASVPAAFSGYMYQVILTDATCTLNSTTSANAKITPYTNVTTTAPANVGICPNGNATFTSTATPHNGSATYQWQSNNGSGWSNLSNGGIYSGVNTSTLTLTNVSPVFNNLQFRVIAQDGCGSVTQATSTAAILTVYGGASITTNTVPANICSGSNASFSVVASASNGSLTYQWWVNPGTGTFVTVGNTSVYSGANSATLALTAPPAGYNGYQYYVVVKDGCSALQVQSNTVALNYYSSIPVTSAPTSQTVCPNASASFGVSATPNSGSLSFQWQVNNGSGFSNVPSAAPYGSSGTTSTLSISSATTSMNGYQYRVIVTDACGTSTQYTSPAVNLTVNNTVGITTNLTASTSVCINSSLNLNVVASGTGLTYQWQENKGSSWANLSNIGVYSGVTTNTLAISSVSSVFNGYLYRLQITGTCSSATSVTTSIAIVTPPTITSDPTSSTICAGTTTSISASASGTSPAYQWQFSSTGSTGTFSDIGGATLNNYTISGATASNAGYYQMKASNSCGFSTSNSAKLNVNPITTISTQPASTFVCPTFSASFTVTPAGTGPFSYQWFFDNNTNTWTSISGATSSTYSVTNASTLNAGKYRVDVTGACGVKVTSSAATLTVNPVPAAPTVADASRCGDGLISTTASSTSPSPSYNWYLNFSDVTPVFTGAMYTINNLTSSATYFVTTVSQTCESSKQAVNFNHIVPSAVNLGGTLNLCSGQGVYNLANDITSANANGGTFTWSYNSTNYSGNNFDPSIGAGAFTVLYTPTLAAQGTPTCYQPTTRSINVVTNSGTGGIIFSSANGITVSNGNTINSCVGDSPINLSALVNIANGTWTVNSGSGISSSGSNTIFTPTSTNYTATSPNAFDYTVTVNGCTGTSTLYIYVKNNTNPPVISGLPVSNCPGTTLNITATVSSVGSYGYQWYAPGASSPFFTGATLKYTVTKDTTLYARSLDQSFGCLSPATQVSIATPFKAGLIKVDKSNVQPGDFVKFTFSGGSAGNSFAWDFGDGVTSFEQNPVHYYYTPGTYTPSLQVNSSIGCSTSLNFNSVVVAGEVYKVVTTVGEPISPAGEKTIIKFYPNPVQDDLSVESNKEIIGYKLFSATGVEVESKDVDSLTKLRLNLKSISSGLYILEIVTSKEKVITKIIKE